MTSVQVLPGDFSVVHHMCFEFQKFNPDLPMYTYEWVDVPRKPDGETMVWTGSQKPHYAAEGVAAVLGVPSDKMQGIWVRGPGSYGRGDAGDGVSESRTPPRP